MQCIFRIIFPSETGCLTYIPRWVGCGRVGWKEDKSTWVRQNQKLSSDIPNWICFIHFEDYYENCVAINCLLCQNMTQ